MKLPSITQIAGETRGTVSRFPFSLLSAVIATCVGIILIDHEPTNQSTTLFPILFCSVLGFFFLTALVLIAERMRISQPRSLLVQAAGAILIVLYGLAVPTDLPIAPEIHGVRFSMLLIGLFFFLMVAPFWRKGEVNGFWQYNKTIFLRALTSMLFGGVLFAGLSIALMALQNLFGLDIDGKRYPELWALIAGIFSTTFFLSGIPDNLDELDESTDYPKGLRIFAQYVLMSLVVVYFVILYAYVGKILLQWNWPKGWVAELILGFTVTGVISLVLLHPLRLLTTYAWFKRAWTWYYILLIPLIIVLFLAINRRISDYGITEERYIVLAFGVWLTGMSIYFLAKSSHSIKIIPATLCALALGLSFGPWGVFSVSENCQISRLESLLLTNKILENGVVRTAPSKLPAKDAREISSIVGYIRRTHGLEPLQPWFNISLKTDSMLNYSRYIPEESVMATMGVPYYAEWQSPDRGSWYLSAKSGGEIDISGYNHALVDAHFSPPENIAKVQQGISYRASPTLDSISFWIMRDSISSDTVKLSIRPLADSLLTGEITGRQNEIPQERMIAIGESNDLRIKLCLRTIYIERHGEKDSIVSCSATILYSEIGAGKK